MTTVCSKQHFQRAFEPESEKILVWEIFTIFSFWPISVWFYRVFITLFVLKLFFHEVHYSFGVEKKTNWRWQIITVCSKEHFQRAFEPESEKNEKILVWETSVFVPNISILGQNRNDFNPTYLREFLSLFNAYTLHFEHFSFFFQKS